MERFAENHGLTEQHSLARASEEAVTLGPNMLLRDVQWFSHFRKLFKSSSDLNIELPHGQQNHLHGNIHGNFKQHPYKRACTNIC